MNIIIFDIYSTTTDDVMNNMNVTGSTVFYDLQTVDMQLLRKPQVADVNSRGFLVRSTMCHDFAPRS